MHRRQFITALGSAAALSQFGCLTAARGSGTRRLKRVGLQLYSLRDDARRDLARTIADIAAVGYNDVELLGSMNNFGMPPKELRRVLDSHGLRAPSTHVGGNALDNLPRQLDDAQTLGHEYLIVASLPIPGKPTPDDYLPWSIALTDRSERTARLQLHLDAEVLTVFLAIEDDVCPVPSKANGRVETTLTRAIAACRGLSSTFYSCGTIADGTASQRNAASATHIVPSSACHSCAG